MTTSARQYALAFEKDSARRFEIPEQGDVVIGRDDEAAIRLDAKGIAQRHARISVVGGEMRVRRLQGLETLVNGRPIGEEMALATGDILAIGDVELVVHAKRRPQGPIEPEALETFEVGDRRVHVLDLAMRRLFNLVRTRLANAEMPVIIEGETGTGKDLVASALHAYSPRRGGPFVSVNCAALPDQLLESELFGHERGAFSGATSPKEGLVEAADHGVLFLDEVGELPMAAQAKMLRVIESKRVRRIGEIEERPVDIRIIAATNRILEDEVEEGRFRRDLYFRLQGAQIWIPPLRDRLHELPPLAQQLVADACRRQGVPQIEISTAAMAHLTGYAWPGNVRELLNLAAFAAAVVEGNVLEPRHVEAWLLRANRKMRPPSSPRNPILDPGPPPAPTSPTFRPIAQEIEELERRRILEALEASGQNRKKAAQLIGMPLRTFATKLKLYGIVGSD
jgi:DNA-binding NtrC family response regulator